MSGRNRNRNNASQAEEKKEVKNSESIEKTGTDESSGTPETPVTKGTDEATKNSAEVPGTYESVHGDDSENEEGLNYSTEGTKNPEEGEIGAVEDEIGAKNRENENAESSKTEKAVKQNSPVGIYVEPFSDGYGGKKYYLKIKGRNQIVKGDENKRVMVYEDDQKSECSYHLNLLQTDIEKYVKYNLDGTVFVSEEE